ncbi:DUF1993 domain-containing protein [Woodsholea maritima]|uniref:DUF1993 domain-containing protein n=1 Tax=Woodsholea maritima TaxID=240237 RepID=UPI00037B65B7|nr:DUF1993 domain-containing protein [Woodsholea maritima]
MSLTRQLIPAYTQMLEALSSWLSKAEAQLGADKGEALLRARLIEDMYPLATQVRFTCLQAYEMAQRLKGEALSPVTQILTEEGRQGGDNPGTLNDAQARLHAAIAALKAVPDTDLDGEETREIAIDLPNGMIFDMTGEAYARDWAVPQFYFHLMIAYAILRAGGVDLGKADYVGHVFKYLRPGTMPGASQG